MNKHTPNAPIALHIEDVVIRQDAEGRYSLNDLHKASGGDKKFQPANFLRLDTTKALVEEIDRSSDLRNGSSEMRNGGSGLSNAVSVIQGGTNQGTYVVKELVYAYAMWISPAFTLKVIRTFDAAQTFVKTSKLSMSDMIKADKHIHSLYKQYLSAKDANWQETLLNSLVTFCASANKPLPPLGLSEKAIAQGGAE